MYFLSQFMVAGVTLLTDPSARPTPDPLSETYGDHCLFCGGALAEHDRHCRGCGGNKSFVSARSREGRTETSDDEKAASLRRAVKPDPIPEWEQRLEQDPSDDGEYTRQLIAVNPNAINARGETPLMAAVRLDLPDLAEWILRQGGDPNLQTLDAPNGVRVREGLFVPKERAPGQTALIWTIWMTNDELMNMLLAFGADPNLADHWGQTPMHWAAMQGRVDLAMILLSAGAQIDRSDDLGVTPLLAAAKAKHSDVVKLLRRVGANAKQRVIRELGGYSLLHLAAAFGNEQMIAVCAADADLDQVDSHLATPLITAIAEERIEAAIQLIGYGTDVDIRAGQAAPTALWAACWLKSEPDSLQLVNEILQAGADPNLPGLFSEPPLLRAIRRGHIPVVHRLLQSGADYLETDQQGLNALMASVQYSTMPLVEHFLKAGISVNSQTPRGETAIMFAHDPGIIRLLKQHGADLDAQSETGHTALMQLADHNLDAASAMIELGANVALRNDAGQTASQVARARKKLKLAELLESFE